MERVYIVIPVLNGWKQTQICLDALRNSAYRDQKIIVVDHGSTDETAEALSSRYPEVLRVPGEPTLWWTGATNLGIRTAMDRGATHVLLLNNDCYVERATLSRLIAHAHEHPDAIIAPVQRDYFTNRILCVTATTCYLLGFSTVILPRHGRLRREQKQLLPTKLIIGGRGVLIPAMIFHRLGLFDEAHLPHAGSDNDFYMRCRRRQIPLLVATDATVHVDNTRTTLAAGIEQMDFQQFLQTLVDRRSHRNIRDVTALFKLHYPIPGCYYIGVFLNLLRYFALYGGRRSWRLLLSLVNAS